MFYIWNKNRHPGGLPPEKKSKWVDAQQPINILHTLKVQHLPHLLLHPSPFLLLCRHLSAAWLWMDFFSIFGQREPVFSSGTIRSLTWPCIGVSSSSSPLSTSLAYQWSPPSTFMDQWRLKWIFSVLWNLYLQQKLFTSFDATWASDELVKLLLARNLSGGELYWNPEFKILIPAWAGWVLLSETLRHWHFLDLLPLLLYFHVLIPSWTFMSWFLPSPLELGFGTLHHLLKFYVSVSSFSSWTLNFLVPSFFSLTFKSWFPPSPTELLCLDSFLLILNFHVLVSSFCSWIELWFSCVGPFCLRIFHVFTGHY